MSSSGFAALCSAFGKYDVVHIHAEGPAFFAWLPKLLGKRVVVTIHGIDWQREKWQSGLGSKFIHQGEKNAAKYADEVIVLSKGVQDYFKETYGKELWIDRRENSKSLAWSSVLLALNNIKEVGAVVNRPKALGDIRGVTYIYGMFYRFGLIDMPDKVNGKMKRAGRQM